MINLRNSDIQIIDSAFEADPGYVLDFSDRTFREFFENEFEINIDDIKYKSKGTSKMNRLRTFCRIERPAVISRVLRKLWEYRLEKSPSGKRDSEGVQVKLFDLIGRIEGSSSIARTDAIERFVVDETLNELVASIERDIAADRPAAALDRLHTYCAKKFGHLLDQRGVTWDRSEPLNSRVGKYVKEVKKERELRDMTEQILKNSISVFEKFNYVRNEKSLAHDNELLDKAEARFIFDSVCAVLRFVKSIDTVRFKD